MGIFVGAPPGMIQKSTEPMLKKLGGALEALVRADVTFKCLMTLAPLAMSVIPALMKGASEFTVIVNILYARRTHSDTWAAFVRRNHRQVDLPTGPDGRLDRPRCSDAEPSAPRGVPPCHRPNV
jgi:hypothetical protein